MSRLRGALRTLGRVPASVAIAVLRAYQIVLSPMTGPSCKYYPSCSSYGITALRTHGFFRGGFMAAWRILRCNPWSHGGVDDVPPPRQRVVEQELITQ